MSTCNMHALHHQSSVLGICQCVHSHEGPFACSASSAYTCSQQCTRSQHDACGLMQCFLCPRSAWHDGLVRNAVMHVRSLEILSHSAHTTPSRSTARCMACPCAGLQLGGFGLYGLYKSVLPWADPSSLWACFPQHKTGLSSWPHTRMHTVHARFACIWVV